MSVRAWLLAVGGGAALLGACGLGLEGVASFTADDGGAASGLDGAAPADAPSGIDGATGDAGPEPREGGRPPNLGSCNRARLSCATQTSGLCTDDSCGSLNVDAGDWPVVAVSPGSFTDTSSDCYAASNGPGSGYKEVALGNAPRYFYELRFLFVASLATRGVVADVGVGAKRVRLETNGAMVRLCSPNTPAGESCSSWAALPYAQRDLRIYGQMGSAQPFGSAIVDYEDVVDGGCTELGALDLEGPFIEGSAPVTARLGCIGDGGVCNVTLDDLRFSVIPY